MTAERAATRVVVAGDVTIDWNLAHRRCGEGPAEIWTGEDFTRACWQRGGAALLADLVGAVADELKRDGLAEVELRRWDLPTDAPRPDDSQFHHSYALWSRFDGGAWRVQEFLGLDRCRDSAQSPRAGWHSTDQDETDADLVLLDDAGLGFRNTPAAWPQAIKMDGKQPLIVLKIAKPIAHGPLWDYLIRRAADRLIVVMSIADLRRTEVQISQQLSWERTVQDVVWELKHNPRVNGLSRCAHTVISFGPSGAMLLSSDTPAVLFCEPAVHEGGWEENRRGRMIGNTTTLTAAIVRQLLLDPDAANLAAGIQSGVAGMRTLYTVGYGSGDTADGNTNVVFPVATIAAEFARNVTPLTAIPIQDPVRVLSLSRDGNGRPHRPGFWTILEDRYPDTLDRVATEIVLDGLDSALSGVPIGKIGGLTTVDRHEVEALRSVQGLIAEYCRHKQKRPLSLAVFGPPGSGKSFGVEQVANSVCPGEIKSLTFNLSQFATPAALHGALHQVRDVGLQGHIPLIFWDEFDTSLDGQPLGWLRYFLAPMQDGSFQEGQITHPIGRSIFVFAGGTSPQFGQFASDLTEEARKAAKVPDFVSRLKGFLNVLGPNRQDDVSTSDPYYIIRRAILLRSLFERNTPQLFSRVDGKKRLKIDLGVLRGLLQTRVYKHGIRSMESLIAMSALSGKTAFDRSSLPAEPMLEIHVDSLNFLSLVQQIVLTKELTELLAQSAHEVYCDGKKRDGWKYGEIKSEEEKTHPLLKDYSHLPEWAKEANRVTVRSIPQKLAAAGYVMLPARSDEPPVEFPGDDLEKLAELEHELWMKAKLDAGFTQGKPLSEESRQNEYLVKWEAVPESIRQADRDLVRGIPRILSNAGYTIAKTGNTGR